MTGFRFNDVHCRDFFITMRSVDRTTLPPLRRREIAVPGRHGRYDFGENKYDNRTISIEVFIEASNLAQLRQRVRNVAGWLKNKGRLAFDDEPDKFYVGRLYNQVPLDQVARNGRALLVFDVEPFAYGELISDQVTRTDETPLNLFVSGTEESPAEYTIINDGESPVENIRVKIVQPIIGG